MRKTLVPVLVILLLAEIGVALAVVAAQPDGFDTVFGVFGPERRQELPVQTFSTAQGANLVVDNGNGKIEVVGAANTDQVTVKATKIIRSFSDKGFDRLTFEAKQNGNDVIINGNQSKDWFGWLNRRIDVQVTVPAYMVANLTGGNGEVTVSGLDNSAARHQIKNSNGFINLTGVKAAQLTVKNDNGGITLQDVSATLNAENGNGAIKATNSTLSLERIKNDNGEIRLNGKLQQTADGYIETGNGSLKLQLDPASPVRFDISTGNGSIDFKKAMSFQSRDNHHVVTSGSGPLLRVKSGNGSVTVE